MCERSRGASYFDLVGVVGGQSQGTGEARRREAATAWARYSEGVRVYSSLVEEGAG